MVQRFQERKLEDQQGNDQRSGAERQECIATIGQIFHKSRTLSLADLRAAGRLTRGIGQSLPQVRKGESMASSWKESGSDGNAKYVRT